MPQLLFSFPSGRAIVVIQKNPVRRAVVTLSFEGSSSICVHIPAVARGR
jgi:hypothetical protein